MLAGAIIAVINPAEQLARGRDASRLSAVSQLGKAMERYTVGNPFPPSNSTSWQNPLVSSGELKSVITVTAPPNNNCYGPINHGNICYADDGGTCKIIYLYVESQTNITKAACSGSTPAATYLWLNSEGRAGLGCSGSPICTGPVIKF